METQEDTEINSYRFIAKEVNYKTIANRIKKGFKIDVFFLC